VNLQRLNFLIGKSPHDVLFQTIFLNVQHDDHPFTGEKVDREMEVNQSNSTNTIVDGCT
jgi:hypothetical protein